MSGANRMCFSWSDGVKSELGKKGYSLQYEGWIQEHKKRPCEADGVVLLDESDDDCSAGKPPAKKDKKKKESEFEERKDAIKS